MSECALVENCCKNCANARAYSRRGEVSCDSYGYAFDEEQEFCDDFVPKVHKLAVYDWLTDFKFDQVQTSVCFLNNKNKGVGVVATGKSFYVYETDCEIQDAGTAICKDYKSTWMFNIGFQAFNVSYNVEWKDGYLFTFTLEDDRGNACEVWMKMTEDFYMTEGESKDL